MKCNICPRECGVDRDLGWVGACKVTNKIYVARVALHMWEEPCISGKEGSGTVFFVGCPLGCKFCQNYVISKSVVSGKEYSVKELADAFLYLQEIGANNINLVTPTHYSYQIIEAIAIAKEKGLLVPIVYNCSGYEKVETLKLLKDTVDIYLTDFKYFDNKIAMEYSFTPDYKEVAIEALEEMHVQKPICKFDDRGIMTSGVIVRNLLLPGHVNNSKSVIEYVYKKYKDDIFISLMNQYTPLEQVKDDKLLSRKVTRREYKRLLDYVLELGVSNAYIQEGDVASESFIPNF